MESYQRWDRTGLLTRGEEDTVEVPTSVLVSSSTEEAAAAAGRSLL